ncbi:MAG TPA: tetratricopeptide repeat protein [Rubrivivax sp.]
MRRGRRSGIAAAALALLLPLGLQEAGAVQSDDSDDQALLADTDYAAGREALKAGDAATALRRYQAALKRFPDAADLHNELGFTHRKLRQMDKAFEHYKRALVLKPQHRGAHEYIGEAYLMVNDLPSAQRHLVALRSICLLPCEELKDLEAAIAEYKAARPS